VKQQHRGQPLKFILGRVLAHVEDLGHANRPFFTGGDNHLMAEEGGLPQCLERWGGC
jgi:hypothetical protein